MASNFNDHRYSFSVAPDEHVDVDSFEFYTNHAVRQHLSAPCFRMAARRSLGWNWQEQPTARRLTASTVRSRDSTDAIELVYLKRPEFLQATQMAGCMLLMPTLLKADSGRSLKIVDAVIGQLAKNIVLDALRKSSLALRNFVVSTEHVSAMNLPKSIYGFGAFAMNVAGSMVDASVGYRTTLKVQGLLADKYIVSEPIAFESVQQLGPQALVHLGVLR